MLCSPASLQSALVESIFFCIFYQFLAPMRALLFSTKIRKITQFTSQGYTFCVKLQSEFVILVAMKLTLANFQIVAVQEQSQVISPLVMLILLNNTQVNMLGNMTCSFCTLWNGAESVLEAGFGTKWRKLNFWLNSCVTINLIYF